MKPSPTSDVMPQEHVPLPQRFVRIVLKLMSFVPPLERWAARQTPMATPGFFRDHLPALVDVRRRAPVVRDKWTGMYWVSRAPDVAQLLKDPRCSHDPHTATSGVVSRSAKPARAKPSRMASAVNATCHRFHRPCAFGLLCQFTQSDIALLRFSMHKGSAA